MKYVNYFLFYAASIFISAWIFNHINSWLGFSCFVGIGYFSAYKVNSFLKGKTNEKV